MSSTLQQVVGELDAGCLADRRCVGCTRLEPAAALDGAGRSAGPARCGLREVDLAEPAAMGCADHSDLAPGGRIALGPVFAVSASGLAPVIAAPDSRKHRDALIDVLENTQALDAASLSARSRIAVRTALELDDPRFYPHLDRIETRLLAGTGTKEPPLGALAHRLLGDDVRPASKGLYIESFTWQGRLLLFLGLSAGYALSYVGLFVLSTSILGWSDRTFVIVGLAFGTPLGALIVRIGIAVFRRYGIPFRADEVRGPGDPVGPDRFDPPS